MLFNDNNEHLWGDEIKELDPIHYEKHPKAIQQILILLWKSEQKCDFLRREQKRLKWFLGSLTTALVTLLYWAEKIYHLLKS